MRSTTKNIPRNQLIAQRVRAGHREDESTTLLSELEATVSHGDNLAHALVSEGFATEQQAYTYVDQGPR